MLLFAGFTCPRRVGAATGSFDLELTSGTYSAGVQRNQARNMMLSISGGTPEADVLADITMATSAGGCALSATADGSYSATLSVTIASGAISTSGIYIKCSTVTNAAGHFASATQTNSGTDTISAFTSSTSLLVYDVPAQVTGVSTGSITPTSATVSWSAPSSNHNAITGYTVEYKLATDSSWTSVSEASTSRALTGLTAGSDYDVRVSAVNGAGTGAASATASFSTGVTGSLSLALTSGDSFADGVQKDEATSVTVSADATPAADVSIDLSRSTADGSCEFSATSGGSYSTTLTVTISAGVTSTAFFVRCAAINAPGDDPKITADATSTVDVFTDVTSADGLTVYDVPAQVTGVSTGSITPTSATVSWSAPSSNHNAITGYTVEYKLATDSSWTSVSEASTSRALTGLTAGSDYDVRVSAVNGAGTGAASATASFSTGVTGSLSLALTSGDSFADGVQKDEATSVTVSADATPAADVSIDLSRSTADGSCEFSATSGGSYSTTLTVTISAGVTSTAFFVRCAAINAPGDDPTITADATSTVDVFTDVTSADGLTVYDVPAQVATPSLDVNEESDLTPTTATLTWSAPAANHAAITGYSVRYREVGSSDWTVVDAGTSTSIALSGLSEATSYMLQAAATNKAGTGSYSSSKTFVTGINGAFAIVLTGGDSFGTGVQKDTATQMTLTITATTSGLLQQGGLTAVVGRSSAAGDCQFSSTSTGTYSQQLNVALADEVMTSTAVYIKCAQLQPAASSTAVTVSRLGPDANDGVSDFTSANVNIFDVPEAVDTVTASAVQPSSATISWSAPGDSNSAITAYKVQYKINGAASYTDSDDLAAGVTSYGLSGLDEYTQYDVQVLARNGAGWSSGSVINFRTGVTGTIAVTYESDSGSFPRADPGMQAGVAHQLRVALNPTDSGDAKVGATEVTVSVSNAASGCVLGDSAAQDATSYVLALADGVSFSTDLHIRCTTVTASNADALTVTETYSASVNDFTTYTSTGVIIVHDVPAAPATPTGQSPSSVLRAVQLTFTAPSDNGAAITSYEAEAFRVVDGATSDDDKESFTGLTTTTPTLSGLLNGQTYSCRVRAVNVAGAGAWSAMSANIVVIPGAFAATPVFALETAVAGALTTASITFTMTTALPADAVITLALPSDYDDVGWQSSLTSTSSEIDGTLTAARVSSTTARVVRSGGSAVSASTSMTLSIGNVRAPYTDGTTGVITTFQVAENSGGLAGEPLEEVSATFNSGSRPVGIDIEPGPRIDSIERPGDLTDNLDTRGGELLTITGQNFGARSNADRVVVYGPDPGSAEVSKYTATGCTLTVPSTGDCAPETDCELQCTSVAGVGGDLYFQLTTGGGIYSNKHGPKKYASPTVSSVTGLTDYDTNGGSETFTVTGDFFGTSVASDATTVTYGNYTAASCSVTSAHTEIECTTVAGVGASLVVKVTVAGQESPEVNRVLSYTPPSITSVTITDTDGNAISTLGTAGGEYITIAGDDFGADAGVTVTYQNTDGDSTLSGQVVNALNCVVVSAHATVRCTSGESVGTGHTYRITVAGQQSSASADSTDYTAPSLSSISPTTIATDGSTSIVLSGGNFGPVNSDNAVTARYENTGASDLAAGPFDVTCSVSTGHTAVTCPTLAGVGSNHVWTVTVGGQASTETGVISSYAAPQVTAVTPDSGLSTQGTDTITIAGLGFGPVDASNTVTATYRNTALSGYAAGPFSASGCSVQSQTAIHCTMGVGVGHGHSFRVTVGGQASAFGGSASYAVPTVSSISPTTMDTDGTTVLTVVGQHFGVDDAARDILFRLQRDTESFLESPEGTACSVDTDHTELHCAVTAGVGNGFRGSVRIGEQWSADGTDSLSYEAPTISALAAVPGTAALSTSGTDVTITGNYFGHDADAIAVSFENADDNTGWGARTFDASCTLVVPQTTLVCGTAGGVGVQHRWTVDVDDQAVTTSSSLTTSYALPTISGIALDARDVNDGLQTMGGETATLTGTNFGPEEDSNTVQVYYQNTALAGPAGNRYDAENCIVETEHTAITCTTVEGMGSSQIWYVQVGGQWSTTTAVATDYAAPVITGFTNGDGLSTAGNEVITIAGQNFGFTTSVGISATYVNQDATEMAGEQYTASNCEITVAHVEAECTTAAGVGTGHHWTLTVGGVAGDESTATTSYAAPAITTVSQAGDASVYRDVGMHPAGGQQVTIVGTNFGPWPAAPSASQASGWDGTAVTDCNGAGCNIFSLSYQNTGGSSTDAAYFPYVPADCRLASEHTKITCTTVSGVGFNQSWSLAVGGQDQSATVTTRYRAPELVSVSISSGGGTMDTRGGTGVTITGRYFGPNTTAGYTNNVLAVCSNDAIPGLPTIGITATDCVMTTVETTLVNGVVECVSGEGVGTGLKWQAEVGGQRSTALTTPTTSYTAPSITNVSTAGGAGLETSGTTTVIIDGDMFGPINEHNQVTATFQNSGNSNLAGSLFDGTTCTVTTAHTRIDCTSGAGVGTGHTWRVTVGSQQSAASTNTTSFAAPALSGVTFANFSTAGGDTITLRGSNFGPIHADNVITASYHNTALQKIGGEDYAATSCDVSVAHTQIECTSVAGAGYDQKWTVNVGGQASVPNEDAMTSYDAPEVTAISPDVLNTDGTTVVTITGRNFGVVDSAENELIAVYQNDGLDPTTMGGLQYPPDTGQNTTLNCTGLLDHTKMRCNTVPGTGYQQRWRVTVGGQPGSKSVVTSSYSPPVITGLTYTVAAGRTGLDTQGGERIEITGTNFGPSETINATINGTLVSVANDVTVSYGIYQGVNCMVTIASTQMECYAAEGVGANHLVAATIGDQTGPYSQYKVSYEPPVVTSFTPLSGPANGGTVVNIHGRYLGAPGLDDPGTTVALGNHTTMPYGSISSHNHTFLSVTLLESPSGNHTLTFTTGNQSSSGSRFQVYNATTAFPAYTPTPGGGSFCIQGSGLFNSSIRRLRFHSIDVLTGQANDTDYVEMNGDAYDAVAGCIPFSNVVASPGGSPSTFTSDRCASA